MFDPAALRTKLMADLSEMANATYETYGRRVVIKPFPRGTEIEREDWSVQDGIVVIPKNATLLPGTVISPETV